MPRCEAQRCDRQGTYREDECAVLCDTHAEIPSYEPVAAPMPFKTVKGCVIIDDPTMDAADGGRIENVFATPINAPFWRRARAAWFLLFPPALPGAAR